MDFLNVASLSLALTQAHRPIRLRLSHRQSTLEDVLLVKHVSDRETVCGGMEYRLLCVSSQAALPLKEFIAMPAELQFVTDRGGLHSVCGIVAEACAGQSNGGLATYQLVMRDALSLMERRTSTRVFRDLNEVDITMALLREWRAINPVLAGAFDVDVSGIRGDYPARGFTMQHDEPDAAFQKMRDMNLEASIWYLFTSKDFFEAAARECEAIMEWFGTLAVSKGVSDFGRNNQVFDKLKAMARDFRRGAELAELGDYKFIWNIAGSVRGNVRGIMEQPFHGWMSKTEYKEFSDVRISRVMTYAGQIESALNNGMVKGKSFFHPSPECPERANDDDGFPGEEIIESYRRNRDRYQLHSSWNLPDPLPEYVVDRSVSCKTGGEVPWTGVWYPETGLERHSLTFAIKGMRMQLAFRIVKTEEELEAEGAYLPSPETVAVATTWHPVIPSGRPVRKDVDLISKAGESCSRAGVWQASDVGATERILEAGDPMPNLGSAYGLTVWRWLRDR